MGSKNVYVKTQHTLSLIAEKIALQIATALLVSTSMAYDASDLRFSQLH